MGKQAIYFDNCNGNGMSDAKATYLTDYVLPAFYILYNYYSFRSVHQGCVNILEINFSVFSATQNTKKCNY